MDVVVLDTDAATPNCNPSCRCPACKRGHPEDSSRGTPKGIARSGNDYATRSPSFEITRESSAPTARACRLTAYIAQFRRVGESFGVSTVLAHPNRTIRVAYPRLIQWMTVRARCSFCAAGPNQASTRTGRVTSRCEPTGWSRGDSAYRRPGRWSCPDRPRRSCPVWPCCPGRPCRRWCSSAAAANRHRR